MKYVFMQPGPRLARWRTIWPARELRRRGYDVDIYAADAEKPESEATGEVTYVINFVNEAWNNDGSVMSFVDICRTAASFGRLIVSFDDDWTRLLDIEPRPVNPLAKIVQQSVPVVAKMADKIIVSTPRLRDVFGGWGVCSIAENYLPEKYLRLKPKPKLDRIAWMGMMPVHGQDWNELFPYAKDLPPLTLIGSGQWAAEKVMSWGASDVVGTDGTRELGRLYREMSRYRLAIIPLADTPFNRGKSWIKAMEFMAQDVRPLTMQHPEYQRLSELTGGVSVLEDAEALVAATVEAWEHRHSGEDLCLRDRLLDRGMTMEQIGGDMWEKALV